jgi:hypothetical protein
MAWCGPTGAKLADKDVTGNKKWHLSKILIGEMLWVEGWSDESLKLISTKTFLADKNMKMCFLETEAFLIELEREIICSLLIWVYISVLTKVTVHWASVLSASPGL